MTASPALKAMVEAMARELVRQDGSDQGRANYSDVDDLHDATLDGHYDLAKVARAGLAAIDVPPLDHPVWRGHDPAAPQAFHDLIRWMIGEKPRVALMASGRWEPIDAILKETP